MMQLMKHTIRWSWKSLLGSALLTSALLINVMPVDAMLVRSFKPPKGQGAPRATASGGSRMPNSCMTPAMRRSNLTALAPTKFMGLTILDRPTMWVYIPETTAKTLEFSLFEETPGGLEGVYQFNMPVPGNARLVSLTLPDAAPQLSLGKPYYWTVALVCNPKTRTDDWLVGGWIQRQAPPEKLKRQLQGANEEQQMSLFSEQGFWYETVDRLIRLRRSQPNNLVLRTAWSELFEIGGLEGVGEPSLITRMKP
ncbi:MAG: DUF928 domain-containing protein [Leptolyngbyaceae cyanobacterium bins.59]|nr:DUF928 domain-containing protein [Leptolyngbyaceae cyanobacterium bins.59]